MEMVPFEVDNGRVRAARIAELLRAGEAIPPLERVDILGRLDLDSIVYPHRLVVRHCTFADHVNLRDAEFKKGLDLTGCTFMANVNASGASVGGSLSLTRVTINRADQPPGLAALSMAPPGSANFERLRVAGDLLASGLLARTGVYLTSARVDGDLYAAPGERRTTIEGDLDASNVKVAGQVNLGGVSVGGDLQLQGADLSKDLFCRAEDGWAVDIGGHAWLVGISVAGQLHLSGATVGKDLTVNFGFVKEGIFFEPREGQYADGKPTVHPARVGGLLGLAESNVPGKVTINGLFVGGDLYMPRLRCGGMVECRTWSPADARLAPITPVLRGGVDLSGSTLGGLVFQGVACDRGPDLSLATIGRLEVREQLCHSPNLEGLQFRELVLPPEVKPITLLGRAAPFRISTWVRFEKWMREQGDDEAADAVYLEMRRRNRQSGMTRMDRAKDRTLDVLVRYGLQSYRLAFLLFAMLVLMSAMLMVDPDAVVAKDTKIPPPLTNATHGARFWTAFRTVVPVVTVFSGDAWKPSDAPVSLAGHRLTSAGGWAIRYDQVASVFSLVSWIAVPLFVAGITGYLRKR